MQRVRFGLDLDGERGWHVRDALGASTVGPLGLLTLLETQLGLTRASLSQAERIVQFRECLKVARTGDRFYEQSFDADELGTTATILGWRDTWIENGWQGNMEGALSSRLSDMGAIELLARERVAPGMGERLRAVAEHLTWRKPQIETLELLDPLDEYPAAWRSVLSLLPMTFGAATDPVARGREGTLLHALQAAIVQLTSGVPPSSMSWRADGSVCVVRSDSRLVAAEWIAAHTRGACGIDRVWIVEQAGGTLEAGRLSADQSLLGQSEPSAFRPVLQLLPLLLRLIWEPLDFKALMQCLTHPVGPLPPYARRRLAEKMASTPGIGGEVWAKVLREIAEHEGESGAGVLADIQFWLDHPRFSVAEQVPLELVTERVARLADLFRRGSVSEDPVRRATWLAGYHQAQALGRTLAALSQQGDRRIGPEALNRLVSQATAAGSEHPLLRAQAGADACVGVPSALIEPFDEVIWWNLAAVPLVQLYPWSPDEIESLRGLGVDLPSTGRLLSRQARGWLSPLLHARERLILMLPGEGEEVHPVWLMVQALVDHPVVVQAEDTFERPLPAAGIAAIPHQPLPARRRWWQIPAGAVRGWDRPASYSSLEQFFYNPSQWVLNYPAQLKSSALLDLPGDFQLLGSLAHRVVEQLYRDANALAWPEAQVLAWFDREADRIVREEGAVLLMSGRRADREAFRLRFRRSLGQLHRLLQAAGASRVEPEVALAGDTPMGTLRGSSDLLVTFEDGHQLIVDMKWAGNKKYRQKLLDQAHIQLAIYARLVEKNSGEWPGVAYYILKNPELLTSARDIFSNVEVIAPPGTSTALIWERILRTWAWRRGQVEVGAIEVALDDLEPTDQSQPPEGALSAAAPDNRFNPFLNLMGWEGEL